jgi:hypothetical protein
MTERRSTWILAALPLLAATVLVALALRARVPVSRMGKLLLLAAVVGGAYLAVRPALCRLVLPGKRWVPILLDVAFSCGFIALVMWVDRLFLLE